MAALGSAILAGGRTPCRRIVPGLPSTGGAGVSPAVALPASRGRALLVSQSYDGIDPGRPTRGDIDRQAGDPGKEQGNKGKSQWVGGGSVEEKAG